MGRNLVGPRAGAFFEIAQIFEPLDPHRELGFDAKRLDLAQVYAFEFELVEVLLRVSRAIVRDITQFILIFGRSM